MFRYTLDEFARLMDAVETDGGVLLEEKHTNTYIKELSGKEIGKGHELVNCGEEALFEINYLPQGAKELSSLVVCGIDDMVGRWPRFKKAQAYGME